MENQQFPCDSPLKIEQIDEIFEGKDVKEEPHWPEPDSQQIQSTSSSQQLAEPKQEEILHKNLRPEEFKDFHEYQMLLMPSTDFCLQEPSKDTEENRKLGMFFIHYKHPSVLTMAELARAYQMSFHSVFRRFEYLRCTNNVICDPFDVCSRVSNRLSFVMTSSTEAASMSMSAQEKQILYQEFKKFENDELDDCGLHLIMENTSIHPFLIKKEYEIILKNDTFSWYFRFAFDDDYECFERNRHPSIEEMIRISEENQIDYTTVFRRFEQLRRSENAVCSSIDTCWYVRQFLKVYLTPRDKLTSKTKKVLNEEFVKFEETGKELTLGYIHLIRMKVDLKSIVIENLYDKFKNNRTIKYPEFSLRPCKKIKVTLAGNYPNISDQEIRSFIEAVRAIPEIWNKMNEFDQTGKIKCHLDHFTKMEEAFPFFQRRKGRNASNLWRKLVQDYELHKHRASEGYETNFKFSEDLAFRDEIFVNPKQERLVSPSPVTDKVPKSEESPATNSSVEDSGDNYGKEPVPKQFHDIHQVIQEKFNELNQREQIVLKYELLQVCRLFDSRHRRHIQRADHGRTSQNMNSSHPLGPHSSTLSDSRQK